MHTPYRTEVDALGEQLLFRRCRIGRDAARDIAQRVEDGHGFWDFEERKRAQGGHTSTGTSVVDAENHDGVPHQLLAGRRLSGEETPSRTAA